MKFDLRKFMRFCAALQIESKERGLVKLEPLLGTQSYVMREIAKGLEDDCHFFTILKGRQLGITTISLALDLYWVFTHPGLGATLVTDTEENREMFRSTLGMYQEHLPKEFKIPLEQHNRNQMVLRNRSRLFYQVAGKRANGGLGRGKAITYLHGTETSSWGDEEGLASLLASLAETNPDRLYLFESTARGFNLFHDMYVTSKKARTQRAIFCGWWRNELYSADAAGAVYKTYWDGKLTGVEKDWVADIKKLYGVEINSRQMAWWRWKLAEGLKDEALMFQEFPPTEDYAFVMTGSSFFSTTRCTDAMKEARRHKAEGYRYVFGTDFVDTRVVRTNDRLASLLVWEEPVDGAFYVIGADPAYGSSDWADRFCVQVFRCYSDGLEQVAEFATSELTTYQFAWVIAHLGGAYKNSVLNLEVNGPGQAVLNEMRNLKLRAAVGEQGAASLLNVLGSMQHYIWRKQDTFGIGNSMGWVTTASSKERMFNYFKDYFERGLMRLKSLELVDEMKVVVREDGSLGATGRGKDDRVVGTALACAAYAEQMLPRLIAMKLTRAKSLERDAKSSEEQLRERTVVSKYLEGIGFKGAA